MDARMRVRSLFLDVHLEKISYTPLWFPWDLFTSSHRQKAEGIFIRAHALIRCCEILFNFILICQQTVEWSSSLKENSYTSCTIVSFRPDRRKHCHKRQVVCSSQSEKTLPQKAGRLIFSQSAWLSRMHFIKFIKFHYRQTESLNFNV